MMKPGDAYVLPGSCASSWGAPPCVRAAPSSGVGWDGGFFAVLDTAGQPPVKTTMKCAMLGARAVSRRPYFDAKNGSPPVSIHPRASQVALTRARGAEQN